MAALTAHDVRHGGFLLLRDSLEANGGFLVVQLMKLAASSEPPHDLTLVAVQHAAAHYAATARKAGLSLPALQASGHMAVVDVLAQLAVEAADGLSKQQQKSAEQQQQQQQHEDQQQPPHAAGRLLSLRSLADCITQEAAALAGDADRPLLLLIDDLSALAAASGNSAELPAFVHACRSLGTRLGRHRFCLAAMVHGDIEDDQLLVTALEHAATVSSCTVTQALY